MIGKSLPLENNYFKTTFLRAPVANQSAFAAEQLIDELAYAAKMDPVAFRLKNIATPTSQVPDVALAVEERARGRGEARQVAAEGRRVEPLERQRRHGPRCRVRALRELARGRRSPTSR